MKLALLAAWLALPALAQTYVFIPQGAEVSTAQVGSSIPGEQVISVVACGAPLISGGAVYQQAAAQGYQPISNLLIPSVTRDVIGKSKAAKVLYALKFATIITAEIATCGVLRIGPQALAGIVFTHGTIDQFEPLVQAKIPNPSALLTHLVDPAQNYAASPSGCYQGLMLARYLGPGPLQARPPDTREESELTEDSPTVIEARLQKVMAMHADFAETRNP